MEIDLTNKCRVCLSNEETMHHLFNEFDQGITLSEIFIDTTNFDVDEHDGLSHYLCENCTSTIVDFYNLKIIYKENENQIKTLLSNTEKNNGTENEDSKCSEESIQSIINDDLQEGHRNEDYITIKVEADPNLLDNDFEVAEDKSICIGSDQLNNIQKNTEDETVSIVNEYEQQEVPTYTCPDCGEFFIHKNEIQEHLSSQHQNFEVDLDELCEPSTVKVIKLDSKTLLNNKCRICHETFLSHESYKQHFEMHKKNVCDICGLGFIKKSYLTDHKEIHFPEKRHVCVYCNKAFKRRTVLVKHRKIHTNPRECICEICGKAFNDKGTLKTHITLLHVKSRNYACSICGVKFPLKATLEKHVRRHENKSRTFFCAQCPLGYKDKSSLDRHIFVKHSGMNKKVTCDQCGKQYTTTSSLAKHYKVCHNVEYTESVKIDDN